MARLPPLNSLKTFETAARASSFTKAAEELHVTQSAVSHQIRQLEDWFGFPLFERHGRASVPTARGAELAAALGDAFGLMASACRRIARAATDDGVTIAALPSVATIWLIPRLADFWRSHPDVPVKVAYAMLGRQPDFGETDLAILWGRGDWEAARATRLFDGATVPVCSTLLLERLGKLDGPDAIAAAPLLHDTDHSGWRAWLRNAGARTSRADGPVFEDFNLLRAAVLAGQGVALCPAAMIGDDLATRRLMKLSDVAILEDHGYYIVEPGEPGAILSPAAALLKSWLLAGPAS